MKIEIGIKDIPIKCEDCKYYNVWSEKCENNYCPVFGHEVLPNFFCKKYEQKQ